MPGSSGPRQAGQQLPVSKASSTAWDSQPASRGYLHRRAETGTTTVPGTNIGPYRIGPSNSSRNAAAPPADVGGPFSAIQAAASAPRSTLPGANGCVPVK